MTTDPDRRPGLPASDLHERMREAAFALLLIRREPIATDDLALLTGTSAAGLAGMLDELASAGWIDRDAAGQVTGLGGPGPHDRIPPACDRRRAVSDLVRL